MISRTNVCRAPLYAMAHQIAKMKLMKMIPFANAHPIRLVCLVARMRMVIVCNQSKMKEKKALRTFTKPFFVQCFFFISNKIQCFTLDAFKMRNDCVCCEAEFIHKLFVCSFWHFGRGHIFTFDCVKMQIVQMHNRWWMCGYCEKMRQPFGLFWW